MSEEQEIKDNNDQESEESNIEDNEESAVKQMTEWLSSQDDNGVSNLEKLQGLQDLSKILKWKHWFDHKDVNGTTGYDKINTLYKLESYDFRQNLEKLAQKEGQYDKQFQEKLDSLEENFADKFDMLDKKFQEVEKLSATYSATLQKGCEIAKKITDTFEQNDEILKEKQEAWDDFQDDCETKMKEFETNHNSILDKTRLELEKLKEEIENIKKESFEVLNLATSAGLSQSYREKIKRISWEINNQRKTFIQANIGILIICSISLVINLWIFFGYKINFANNISDFIMRSLPTLAFITPLIWIAKQNGELLRQNLHIREEYEHKRSLVATYNGYKNTLQEISNDDNNNKHIFDLIESTTKGIMRKFLPNKKNQKLTGRQLLTILPPDHKFEFARENMHTNSIESFWAALKRGIHRPLPSSG